jgi:hypothetical protein
VELDDNGEDDNNNMPGLQPISDDEGDEDDNGEDNEDIISEKPCT